MTGKHVGHEDLKVIVREERKESNGARVIWVFYTNEDVTRKLIIVRVNVF